MARLTSAVGGDTRGPARMAGSRFVLRIGMQRDMRGSSGMHPVRLLTAKVHGSNPCSGAKFEFTPDNDGAGVMIPSASIARGFLSGVPISTFALLVWAIQRFVNVSSHPWPRMPPR
jgi:hypothetical protein